MKLVDLLMSENEGLSAGQLMLLRHAGKEVRLLKQCDATVEEFTAIQKVGDEFDFLRPGFQPVSVVAVIVEDRVYGVFRVGKVLAEGLSTDICSLPYRRFELARKKDDGTPKPVREGRKYELERLLSGATGKPVRGWDGGRSRTPVQRFGNSFFGAIEVDGEPIQRQPDSATPADSEWLEGNPTVRSHLVRERAPGLAAAKKLAFVQEHGRLFCEQCKLDPVKGYDSKLAEACIEVHHATTQVAEMQPNQVTRLSDLQCLCANCHRLVHARLRLTGS